MLFKLMDVIISKPEALGRRESRDLWDEGVTG